MTGRGVALPPLIRDAFELLAREDEDALVQLAAIRTLRGWLRERERASLLVARAQDYTWAEIGRAQGRPRPSHGLNPQPSHNASSACVAVPAKGDTSWASGSLAAALQVCSWCKGMASARLSESLQLAQIALPVASHAIRKQSPITKLTITAS